MAAQTRRTCCWMTALGRAQIESVAAFATYPIATLLTMVHTVQANLQTLAQRRDGNFAGLPFPQTTMPAFKKVAQIVAEPAFRKRPLEMGGVAPTSNNTAQAFAKVLSRELAVLPKAAQQARLQLD